MLKQNRIINPSLTSESWSLRQIHKMSSKLSSETRIHNFGRYKSITCLTV